jgi:hypothetical protein
MNHEDQENQADKRAALLASIEECRAEIRRRLLALVEHPDVPEFFKSSSVVEELIR